MRKPCWVESANDPNTDFPIENLPFGVFEIDRRCHLGVAIGNQILDLYQLRQETNDILDHELRLGLLASERGFSPELWRHRLLRRRLIDLLGDTSRQATLEWFLVPQASVRMVCPIRIGEYTDFYASIHHATNVGRLFRPDNPLLPNYKYVPIGYHGRASSIVVSGTDVRRPCGQTKPPDAPEPDFGPSRMLDYELEMGIFIGEPNQLGTPIPIDHAKDHIFGLCLVNDWSARDIQSWEYQPLGPFLGKSFATTISPWVVTIDALEPYLGPVAPRPEGDPKPLAYLWSDEDQQRGAFDIHLEVSLLTAQMRAAGQQPFRISRGNLRDLYWTPAQMLAHHTSNGCNLRPGDLLATGTISGPTPESVGSLLERTKRGAEPLQLPNGEQRKFLEDGDEVIFHAWCEREGYPRIGFGECRGTITPALQ